MKYLGSKAKYAKYILPIILQGRSNEQWYVEPFVGGFNVIDKVSGNRLANDIHYFLIELFKALQQGWIPPDYITEDEYNDIKNDVLLYSPYLVGFVGFICSFSGKWFNGYAKDGRGGRNYCLEGKKHLLKQIKCIKEKGEGKGEGKGCSLLMRCGSYLQLEIPDKSIIYCDPPYAKRTVGYGGNFGDKFNHELFWNWARKMREAGHKIFVSEYNAPDDFRCIWSALSIGSLKGRLGVEKLWV